MVHPISMIFCCDTAVTPPIIINTTIAASVGHTSLTGLMCLPIKALMMIDFVDYIQDKQSF